MRSPAYAGQAAVVYIETGFYLRNARLAGLVVSLPN